jgi:hypothetical protein
VNGPLLNLFPGLAADGYRETSPPTWDYNCIAWAASRTDRWWEPDASLQFFWPPGVPRQYTLIAYVAAYESEGFVVCPSDHFEIFSEKIVIYVVSNGVPKHAARQLDNGKWTSKLGPNIDIEHATPEAVSGGHYGQPACFMRRRRSLPRVLAILYRRVQDLLST